MGAQRSIAGVRRIEEKRMRQRLCRRPVCAAAGAAFQKKRRLETMIEITMQNGKTIRIDFRKAE